MNESENHNEDRPVGTPEPAPATPAPTPGPESSSPSVAPSAPAAGARDASATPSADPAAGSGGPPAGTAADSPADSPAGAPRPKRRRRRRRGARRPEDGEEAGPGAGAQGPAARPQKKPRREPRREWGRGGRGGKDSTHLATQAVRALADMAQQLLRIEGVDPLAMPRYLDLALRVPLDGGRDVAKAAGTAVDQLLGRVREVREHEKALRPGAVYSYFDDTSHADGCRPVEPRLVFDGYSSTGKPQFVDFVTTAIERKDPSIDRLLAGEEVVLTQVTMGRVLRTQQLAEFGGNSPVFKILGQVNAGLFKVLNAAGKCAFSFQLLRGTTLEGRVRLRLHPVGGVDPMDLADPAIMQILSRFQRRLDSEALRLEGRIQNGETDEEEFVLPLLNDLARQLQSRTRQAGRRTQHGLERTEEGQRPTSRAYPDAGEASDDRILWDVDQGTIVVLGGKNRVHVFSPDGKHVTSVAIQGAAIERRRQLGRWRSSEPEERGEFRIQVRRVIAQEEANAKEATVPSPSAPAGVVGSPTDTPVETAVTAAPTDTPTDTPVETEATAASTEPPIEPPTEPPPGSAGTP